MRGSVLNAPKRKNALTNIHEYRQQLIQRIASGRSIGSDKSISTSSPLTTTASKSSNNDHKNDELSMLRKKQELLHSLLPQEIVDSIHHHWSPPSAGRGINHKESITFSKGTTASTGRSSSFSDSSIPSSIILQENVDHMNELEISNHTARSEGIISTMSSGSSTLFSEDAFDVSMVFVDIVGFSRISEEIPASDVMDMLQDLFHRFDEVCKVHNILKLDTIGDAYLCSAGAGLSGQDVCDDYHQGNEYSEKRQQKQNNALQSDDKNFLQQKGDGGLSHALRALAAAKDMVREAKKVPIPRSPIDDDNKEEYLSVRVGIHVGDATFGVLGLSLPKLVCIGSTVNMAARMEQTCTANMIHVTETFHDLIGDNEIGWECKEKVLIKNMGEVNAYLLDPFKEEDESCWV
jgi:class 3 adenylate cyclase